MSKLALPEMGELLGRLRLSLGEGLALFATVIFVGVVTFYYLNSTQPLRSQLSVLRTKEKSLQSEIKNKTEQEKALREQLGNRDKILDSLERFEGRLHNRKIGITAIIDEVNQIAQAHHVKAGDITFHTAAPEPLPGEPKPGASGSPSPTPTLVLRRDKLPVVYEGLGIDTTVEGDYADLRRFISALERSRNFVIINAITLQSVDEKQRSKSRNLTQGAPPGPTAVQLGGAPGPDAGVAASPTQIIVALKIEMETHFSRDIESKLMPTNAPAPR